MKKAYKAKSHNIFVEAQLPALYSGALATQIWGIDKQSEYVL